MWFFDKRRFFIKKKGTKNGLNFEYLPDLTKRTNL